MKKLLAIAVILLFFGVAVAPSINAVDRNKSRIFRDIPQEKMLRIPIMECKADGTRRQTIVSISRESAKELREKIRQTSDPEEKFLLFQQYGLIPKDVTLEQLRNEMYRVAERYDITLDKLLVFKERLERIPRLNSKLFAVNFNSINNGGGFLVFNHLLGFSLSTGLINLILWQIFRTYPPAIPSMDLIDVFFALFGVFESKSYYDNFRTRQFADLKPRTYIAVLLGFVGFVAMIPFVGLAFYFVGFSLVTLLLTYDIEYFEP